MVETIQIQSEGGRDRIEKIEESTDEVIIHIISYEGNTNTISVPRYIIDFAQRFIDSLDVGVKVKSVEFYETFIREFNIKSAISQKHLRIFKETMESIGFDNIRISYVLDELLKNKEFGLMTYKELIGSRKAEVSHYFKLWASLRYFREKGIIIYNNRGTIVKII